MRDRAGALLHQGGKRSPADEVTISTFHALGLKIIRGDAKALGLRPGFSIMGPDDTEPIVAELIATSDRARARAALWKISQWKNALVPPRAARRRRERRRARGGSGVSRYDDTLRAYQAVDFDDLIGLPVTLLEGNAEAAAKWRQRCGYLLVDEYQDTNAAQYRLLKLWRVRGAPLPPSATTTRRSTAGAAPRSTISRSCRGTIRRSRSSSWSRTTGRPCASCVRPMR